MRLEFTATHFCPQIWVLLAFIIFIQTVLLDGDIFATVVIYQVHYLGDEGSQQTGLVFLSSQNMGRAPKACLKSTVNEERGKPDTRTKSSVNCHA